MINTQYISKVIRSCKTINHLKTAQEWAYRLINTNLGAFDGYITILDVNRQINEMIEYLDKNKEFIL